MNLTDNEKKILEDKILVKYCPNCKNGHLSYCSEPFIIHS